jgi:LL-diaminopimelate aminotransferase
MKFSKLMTRLDAGIFTELARLKTQLHQDGRDVIDLSVGTPNIPPDISIRRTIADEALKDENYVYAIEDLPGLRKAASRWYARRYGVSVNADTEVCAVLGTQEGLAHCCLPLVDPGDTVILPDPCYPAFQTGAALAGAEIFFVPQRSENGFIIDFNDIPEAVADRAKLMIVSYPNNPTTAVAPPSFYRDLVAFAKKHSIFIIHDNAYSDLVFDGDEAGSFLAYDGAKDVGVEFNSLSKSYGLAGARLGFCLGNADYIGMLSRLKSNTDYGIYLPIQKAGIRTLDDTGPSVTGTARQYAARRDVLIGALEAAGWCVPPPRATMFVWAAVPHGFADDIDFYSQLAQETGVIVVPGSAFGKNGRGFVRMALVQNEDRIQTASERIGQFLSGAR